MWIIRNFHGRLPPDWKFGRDEAELPGLLRSLRSMLPVVPVTLEAHRLGLDLAERHRFVIHDSMIAAAALPAGCDMLWSEDMQHGQIIDGRLRIANPFRNQ